MILWKKTEGEGYAVKYTLILSIEENNEEVEKTGDMVIIKGGPKNSQLLTIGRSLL
ncbi:hypothetical protein [Lysinibacillus mangiferihumi]|uniref:hypothetical protein n=1 Tax=Lysinibacillus mangiferihumi TaxID=1130819 RepID=UPI00142D3830|nr:hypothetical protein [Lysinibacillus mangiferihumi]